MVFKNEDDEVRVVIDTCNCGCGSELHIMRFKDTEIPKEPVEYYITLHNSKFDEEQLSIFNIIKRRLKRAWCNLLGKDYVYMEIILKENEYKEFIDNCKDLIK